MDLACGEVNEATTQAKQESWKEILEKAMTEADEGKIWRIAKQLNGTLNTTTPNEVLVHNEKCHTRRGWIALLNTMPR